MNFKQDPSSNLLWKGELGWCICTKNKGFDIEDNVKSMKENHDFGSSFYVQNPLYRSNTDFLSKKFTKDSPKTNIIAPNANT